MNAGRMDRRITLQSRAMTRDETGSRSEAWQTAAEIWAERMNVSTSEAIQSDAERVEVRARWRIRHREISETNHRIIHDGNVYQILGKIEEGREKTIILETRAIGGVS